MKKKLLFLIALFTTCSSLCAQDFSFSDLIECRRLSFDELESFLNQKGFEYYKTTNNDSAKAYHFSFKYYGSIGSYFSTYNYNDGSSLSSFQTAFQSFLYRIKSEGLSLGMKYMGKEDINGGGYILNYSYKWHKIEFWIPATSENNKSQTYKINIYRLTQ